MTSESEKCSRELRASGLPSKERGDSGLSGQTKLTSTPAKSTEGTSVQKSLLRATSAKSKQQTFQTSTYSALDFLAKLFRLQARNGRVQASLVERYLHRLLGLRRLRDPSFYCWKTSEVSFLQALGETSPSSLGRWEAWGIYSSGKCLTASTTELHRIGRGCSLSDILEEHVSGKYFLSERMLEALERHSAKHRAKGHGFGATIVHVSQLQSAGKEAETRASSSRPRTLFPADTERTEANASSNSTMTAEAK